MNRIEMAEEETNATPGMTGLKQRRIAASRSMTSELEFSTRRSTASNVSLKLSQAMDIETGRAGSRLWLVEEVLRHKDAMDPALRRRKQFFESMYFGQADAKDEESTSPPQYRLGTKKHYGSFSWLERFSGLASDGDESPTSDKSSGITRFLNWTFRTTFPVLILVQALFFWFATIVWALIIMTVGKFNPGCITVAGEPYDHHFIDAFALSWTTFSTVGYGLVYPTLSVVGGRSCIGINAMMSIEAFMGVLFAAVMGAVVFGKVCRIQSHANITFSDPIVIRYGTGVSDTNEGEEDDPHSVEEKGVKRLRCPVMEFRIINAMHKTAGGEIMNAFINCTANINASNAHFGLPHHSGRRRIGKKGPMRAMTANKQKSKSVDDKKQIKTRSLETTSADVMIIDIVNPDTATSAEMAFSKDIDRYDEENYQESAPMRSVPIPESIQEEDSSLDSDGVDKSIVHISKNKHASTQAPQQAETPTSSMVTFDSGTATPPRRAASKRMIRGLSSFVPSALPKSLNPKHQVKALVGAARSAAETIGGHAVSNVFNHVSSNVFSPMMGSHDGGYDPDDDGFVRNDGPYRRNDGKRKRNTVVDEGSGLVTPRFFAPLELETPSHPFFKRVWVVRHTLNENSPLLSGFARTLISENDGYWPEELNSYDKVREHIDFHELIVSFSGTANATGSAVYQQTIYTLPDMAVGYTFANVLQNGADGHLQVADDLINDVVEQKGGGGEPLDDQPCDRGFFGALEAFGDEVGNILEATTEYIGLGHFINSDSDSESGARRRHPLDGHRVPSTASKEATTTPVKASAPAFSVTTRGDEGGGRSLFQAMRMPTMGSKRNVVSEEDHNSFRGEEE